MNTQFQVVRGAEIGNYLGAPIYESIEDDGVTYVFDRIAQEYDDGYPLSQLHTKEVMFKPGLIYRPK